MSSPPDINPQSRTSRRKDNFTGSTVLTRSNPVSKKPNNTGGGHFSLNPNRSLLQTTTRRYGIRMSSDLELSRLRSASNQSESSSVVHDNADLIQKRAKNFIHSNQNNNNIQPPPCNSDHASTPSSSGSPKKTLNPVKRTLTLLSRSSREPLTSAKSVDILSNECR